MSLSLAEARCRWVQASLKKGSPLNWIHGPICISRFECEENGGVLRLVINMPANSVHCKPIDAALKASYPIAIVKARTSSQHLLQITYLIDLNSAINCTMRGRYGDGDGRRTVE